MDHDTLARSLADHLRGPDRMVWCDIQLGPAGSPRPDVYAMLKSFMRPQPIAYECKVSRSDFRADVTAGKWQSYLPYAAGVCFACESGLISKADVPEHCGLIVLKDGAWRAAKKPTLRSVEIPQKAFLKLLIDGVEREGPRYRAKVWSESASTHTAAQRFGEVLARTVRERVAVEKETAYLQLQAQRLVDDARRQAERIRTEASQDIAPLRAELCEALGLRPESDVWTIRSAVHRLKTELREHPAQERWRRMTSLLESVLAQHGYRNEAMAAAGRDED